MKRLVVLLGAFIVLGGCTSMKPIELQPVAEGDRILEIGDKVRVTTKTGEQYSFKVTSLSPESIGGEEAQLSIDDIALIEVKQLNSTRTGVGLGAGIGAVWIVVGIMATAGAAFAM